MQITVAYASANESKYICWFVCFEKKFVFFRFIIIFVVVRFCTLLKRTYRYLYNFYCVCFLIRILTFLDLYFFKNVSFYFGN